MKAINENLVEANRDSFKTPNICEGCYFLKDFKCTNFEFLCSLTEGFVWKKRDKFFERIQAIK